MKKRENIYRQFQSYIKNKDNAVQMYLDNTLAQTQSMFEYDGLPDTIPHEELERLLQETGCAFVTVVNSGLYAFQGARGGEPDVYGRATLFTVANPALRLAKVYEIGKDGVLMLNDTNGSSLLPLIGKYAVLYTDGVISLNTASIMTRITMLISASDDKTKASADEFLKKILDGDFSVIGENAFFKGVNLQTTSTSNSAYINQLVELIQYYRASMYNELGLQANYNMKRERLTQGEVATNVDALLPYVDNMLKCRERAVEQINAMFGTNISVRLGSSWHLNHDNYESLLNTVETHENEPITEEHEDKSKENTQTEEEEKKTAPDERKEEEQTVSQDTEEKPAKEPENDEDEETKERKEDDEES